MAPKLERDSGLLVNWPTTGIYHKAKIYRNQLAFVQNLPKPHKGLVKELLILENIKVYMQKLKE